MPNENPVDAIKDALSKAGKQIQDNLKAGPGKISELPSETEDLNILPLPDTQWISKDEVEWVWAIEPNTQVSVVLHAVDKDDHRGGDFEIILHQHKSEDYRSINATYAKRLGQVLISASNWHNVWKDHVGTLLERSLGGPWIPTIGEFTFEQAKDLESTQSFEFGDKAYGPVIVEHPSGARTQSRTPENDDDDDDESDPFA